jgi:ornithine decarboxylase
VFFVLTAAVKANPDLNIVRTLHVLGSGFDCASKTEIEEVLLVGVPPQNIIYANPCKGKGPFRCLVHFLH